MTALARVENFTQHLSADHLRMIAFDEAPRVLLGGDADAGNAAGDPAIMQLLTSSIVMIERNVRDPETGERTTQRSYYVIWVLGGPWMGLEWFDVPTTRAEAEKFCEEWFAYEARGGFAHRVSAREILDRVAREYHRCEKFISKF